MTVSTFTSTHARSWRTSSSGGGSAGWRFDDANTSYQGQFFSGGQGFGRHKGVIFFDDAAIRSTLDGETITQVRLRMTRQSGGTTAPQTPTIRPHNYSSQPSGEPSYGSGTVTSQSWGTGQTEWVTLPNSWGNGLRDGTIRGVGTFTTSNTPYMLFAGHNVVLEITHEPTVVPPTTPNTPTLVEIGYTGYTLSTNTPTGTETWRWNPQDAGTDYAVRTVPEYTRSPDAPGETHFVRVRACNSAGCSAYSDYLKIVIPPAPPSGIEVSTTDDEVSLTWDAQTLGEGGAVDIYRDGTLVHTTTGTAWTDTGRASSTRYGYTFRARNDGGDSPLTSVVYAYTDAPDPAPSALVDVATASTQLEDGTTVFALVDSAGDYTLHRALLDGSLQGLGTIETDSSEVQTLGRSGKLQSIAMTSDRVGNVYIVGRRGAASGRVGFYGLRRDGSDAWTLYGVRSTAGADLDAPQGFSIAWADEGNGTDGAGRIIVAYSSGVTGQTGFVVVNAADVVATFGGVTPTASGTAPTWLVPSTAYGTMRGTGIDLTTDQLGSSRVGVVSCVTSTVTGGVMDRVRLARLTVGASISSVSAENVDTSFPWVDGADHPAARVVGYGSDDFAAVWSGPGDTHHVKRIGSGSVAHLGSSAPADSEAFSVDYSDDDEAVYVYTWRDGDLYRAPWFPATSSLGAQVLVAEVTDTDLRSIRLPKVVADGRFIEAHYAHGTDGFVRVVASHNQPPNAPTVHTVPPFDADNAQDFSWTFNDPNPADTQGAYHVQIERTDTGASVIDTGKVASADEFYTITAATLTNGVGYRGRVKTWDEADEEGPWSTWRTFSPSAAAIVAITDPLPDGEYIDADREVVWTYSHPDSDPQDEYRARILDQSTGDELMSSGWVSSAAVSHLFTDLETGSYTAEVQARTAGVPSNVDTVDFSVDVTTPDEPIVVVDAREGYVRVSVENPTPSGDRPPITDNRIYRRRKGETDWLRIAIDVGNSGNYDDYNAPSGIPLEYKVRANADEGGFIDSPEREVTLLLEGVWLHDLTDSPGTLHQYRYSGGQRTETYSAETELLHFAGRPFPVADYGEHGDQGLDVEVFIPYGASPVQGGDYLRSVIDRRAMVVYRDNRGRVVFAALHGLSFTDVQGGTVAAFRVDRVNHTEEV